MACKDTDSRKRMISPFTHFKMSVNKPAFSQILTVTKYFIEILDVLINICNGWGWGCSVCQGLKMAGSHLGVTEWREKQPGATSSNLNVPHATQRLYLCPIQQGAQLNSCCASQGCHWWPRPPHWALDPGERASTRVQITWGTFLSSSSVPIFLLPRLSSLTFPLVGTPGTSETLLVYTQTIYIYIHTYKVPRVTSRTYQNG